MNSAPKSFPWRALVAVLLLATVVRGGLLLRSNCISRDGVHFVTFAKQLQTDPVRWMQITTKQPGYAFLLAWTHRLIGPALGGDSPIAWQLTGELIALIGGLAVCAGVFLLTRRVFDDRYALLAGVLSAFWTQGALLSADVLSDMPHLAIYMAALGLALATARRSSFAFAILAGFVTAAAYWIRQEALGLVATVGLCLLLERSIVLRRRFMLAATFTACFVIGAAPYSILKRSVMPNKNPGDALTMVEKPRVSAEKKSPASKPATSSTSSKKAPHKPAVTAKPEAGPAVRPAHDATTRTHDAGKSNQPTHKAPPIPRGPHVGDRLPIWELPGRMAEDWARSGRYVLAMLALAALFLKSVPRADARAYRFILIAIAMQFLLVAARTIVYGEISSRYMAIPAALTIPWAAAAMFTLTTRVADRIHNPTRPRRGAVWASALMLAIFPMLFYIARPEPRNKDAFRAAGLALAAQRGPDDVVLAHPRMEQLLYYADLVWPDEKRWIRINESASAGYIERHAAKVHAQWYVDAFGTRDVELDVPELIDALSRSDRLRFSPRAFDGPESLRAYLVSIRPMDGESAPAARPSE